MGVIPKAIKKMCVCKLRLMENNHSVGEESWLCGNFKMIYGREFWLKFRYHWLFQLPTAPLCVQTLSDCSPAPPLKNENIRYFFYIYIYIYIYTCSLLFVKIHFNF